MKFSFKLLKNVEFSEVHNFIYFRLNFLWILDKKRLYFHET